MKTKVTADMLVNKTAPAKVQRAFERRAASALHEIDSAAGDREIRQMVAETFVNVYLPNFAGN